MSVRSIIARTLLSASLAAAEGATGAQLAASIPQPDAIVATQLLPHAQKDALRRLTAAAAETDPAQRLVAARRMIELGRINGDPRTLGYAESILAPWPADAAETPVD